jgi:cell fate regulator YaaT (PSP1 superfamily)
MEKAVKADLAAMKLPVAAAYLGQSAVLIARAIDGYAETAESAAQLSAIVKANVELRQTMAAIQKAAAGSSTAESAEDDVEGLATPS